MVSQTQKEVSAPSGPFLRFLGEPLPDFRTVRVLFRKAGSLSYISHLDLQRVMMRILVLAGIPMWYTQGFNPHAKVVFALPLPVGVESECELMDLRICRDVPCEELTERLNAVLTDEMKVKEIYIPERKFQEIDSADYAFTFRGGRVQETDPQDVERYLLDPERTVLKKGKNGDKEIALKNHLRRLRVENRDGELRLYVNMPAGGDRETLSPLSVAQTLLDAFSWYGSAVEADYAVTRLHIRDDRMREFR